jgi:hypothetical protein
MIDAVFGETSGALSLTQSSTAGSGGDSFVGAGGVAGNASSLLTLLNSPAALVNAEVGAVAGNGGKGGSSLDEWTSYDAAAGGNAVSMLNLRSTSLGAVSNGYSHATGGNGGNGYGPNPAAGGAAEAYLTVEAPGAAKGLSVAYGGNGGQGNGIGAGGNATAQTVVRSSGAANAEARAYGGAGGTQGVSNAYASATGTGSTSYAYAGGAGNSHVSSSVTAAGNAVLTTESFASNAGQAYPTGSTAQAYSTAHGQATAAQAAALLDGHTVLAAALSNGTIYGSGIQGTNYAPSAAPGAALAYTLVGQYSFDLAQTSTLVLGLLDYAVLGNGFDSLTLSVDDNGTQLFSKVFATLSEAQLFFSDHALSLGVFGPGLQDLTVTSQILTNASSGFSFNYLVGAAGQGIPTGDSVSPVPEAQGWLLMLPGLGFVLMVAVRRRRAGAAV